MTSSDAQECVTKPPCFKLPEVRPRYGQGRGVC